MAGYQTRMANDFYLVKVSALLQHIKHMRVLQCQAPVVHMASYIDIVIHQEQTRVSLLQYAEPHIQ